MLRVAENPGSPSIQSTLQKFVPRSTTSSVDRILVVEDDHAVQKALKRLFEAEGYGVQIAPDGNQAVEQFRMTGRRTTDTEIIGSANQAGPEMISPDTVHDDPGREWMAGGG